MDETTKISHKNTYPNNGHNWEAIAVFEQEIVNDTKERRPLLWVRCFECKDTRIIIGNYFIKG